MPSWPCVVRGIVSRLQNKNKNVVIGSFNDLAISSSIFKKMCVVSNCNGFKRIHERQELSSSVCQVEMVYSILWFPFSWEKMSLKWKWWKLNGIRLEKSSAFYIIQYIRKFINLSKETKWLIFIQTDNSSISISTNIL